MEKKFNCLFKTLKYNNNILMHKEIDRIRDEDGCSCKMDSQKVVFKGEIGFKSYISRKAYIRVYSFEKSAPIAFLKTSQYSIIYGIVIVQHMNQEFILESGNSQFLDIFTYNASTSPMYIGKSF